MHDVKEENEPLTLVKKKYAKKFIENTNYKNESSYNHLAEDQYKLFLKIQVKQVTVIQPNLYIEREIYGGKLEI